MSRARRQRGFSLIELMLALVIGLIIIAVVGQVFLSGRRSFDTQSGMGTLQENGRFALYFLQRDIRMAGFPRTSGPSTGQPIASAFVTANTLDGASGASDQIEFQFNSDPAMPNSDLDCTGSESNVLASGCAAGTTNPNAQDDDGGCSWLVIDRYRVVNGSLMCLGNGNATEQPLVSGVESLQFLYGEDTDGDTYANVYRAADAVANWNTVVAVRVGLLLNSVQNARDDNDTRSYAVLDAPVITPADNAATYPLRLGRRVFTSTIEVRNRTQ